MNIEELREKVATHYLNPHGDKNQIITDCSTAINLDPSTPLAYLVRGNAYNDLKQFSKAEEDLNKFVELSPDSAEAYHYRGLNYKHMGKMSEAGSDYKKAIILDPKVAPFWNDLGTYYHDCLKWFDHADKCYEKALQIDPNFNTAMINREKIKDDLTGKQIEIKDLFVTKPQKRIGCFGFSLVLVILFTIDFFYRLNRGDAFSKAVPCIVLVLIGIIGFVITRNKYSNDKQRYMNEVVEYETRIGEF